MWRLEGGRDVRQGTRSAVRGGAPAGTQAGEPAGTRAGTRSGVRSGPRGAACAEVEPGGGAGEGRPGRPVGTGPWPAGGLEPRTDLLDGAVQLLGAQEAVRAAVAPVVAGAGLRLLEPGPAEPPGPGVPVLVPARAVTGPAGAQLRAVLSARADAVLVDVDEHVLWEAAARFPRHHAVVLPAGRAWLAEHLAVGTAGPPGRVLAVGGLGDGHAAARVARAIAAGAVRAGEPALLVDAVGRGSLALAAASAARAHEPPCAGWDEALSWVGDGSVAALVAALPQIDGVPVLGGSPPTDPDVAAAVVESLARGSGVLVVHIGELAWPPALPPGADELVLCLGGGTQLPDLQPGETRVPVSLVTVRSGWVPPDGPVCAELLGAGWAGTFDARNGAAALRRSQRLVQRYWVPRLRAGEPLAQGPRGASMGVSMRAERQRAGHGVLGVAVPRPGRRRAA